MKIVKIQKESKITPGIISGFGQFVYHSPGVESVFIRVNFKNGTTIGFKREENDDEFEDLFKRIDEEEEEEG